MARPIGQTAMARSGWSAGLRRACSAVWPRCLVANGRMPPFKISIQSAPCATSSLISRSICRSCSARSRLQKAGGIRSSELPRAGLPTLYRRAAEIALAEQNACGLRLSFRGLVSTAPTLCAPHPRKSPSSRSAKMRASWSGATACRRWTRRHARLAGSLRARLFLGFDGGAPRFSRIGRSGGDGVQRPPAR